MRLEELIRFLYTFTRSEGVIRSLVVGPLKLGVDIEGTGSTGAEYLGECSTQKRLFLVNVSRQSGLRCGDLSTCDELGELW